MSENLFKKLLENRQPGSVPEEPLESPKEAGQPIPPPPQPEQKKRGRPATGKRSDPDWIGRTFYVKKETDLDVEDELLKLKRQGIELDKSELVDLLLAAWVKWRQGEDLEFLLSEISPRRKGEKPN